MGLFYQHNINGATKLAIWRIEEGETFFLQRVPLKTDVSHPFKRRQHLAGRYLLPFLMPDFPLSEIVIADTRKPFLESERYHFSISHCARFAAAIVSGDKRVGVDIELAKPKIDNIRHKYTSAAEYQLAADSLRRALPEGYRLPPPTSPNLLLTLLWSAKESIFKWYGLGRVDFRQHIRLNGPFAAGEDGWMELPFLFTKDRELPVTVRARFFGDLVLAWVVT